MKNKTRITFQQQYYEAAYQRGSHEYGAPDRKITHGLIPQGKRILSVGGGSASDIWYLAHQNMVVCFDYVVSGLKVAKEHNVQGVVGNMNAHPSLPFNNESFDIIICKDILEHILEPLIVLQDVRRVLKNHGSIVISIPNHFYLPMRLRLLFGQGLIWKTIGNNHRRAYNDWNYMHIRFFTYKSFRRFLREAGLRPQKWFWDFGALAHYSSPDMYLEPQVWKKNQGKPISMRGWIGLIFIRPLWRLFNIFFPRLLRSFIVSLRPGLLCAGFYVICTKNDTNIQGT